MPRPETTTRSPMAAGRVSAGPPAAPARSCSAPRNRAAASSRAWRASVRAAPASPRVPAAPSPATIQLSPLQVRRALCEVGSPGEVAYRISPARLAGMLGLRDRAEDAIAEGRKGLRRRVDEEIEASARLGVRLVMDAPRQVIAAKAAAISGLVFLVVFALIGGVRVSIFAFPSADTPSEYTWASLASLFTVLTDGSAVLAVLTFLAALASNVGGWRQAAIVGLCAILWEVAILGMLTGLALGALLAGYSAL